MEIALNHSLSYTTKGDVPVSIVARSLLANERLLQESVRALASLEEGANVQRVVVRVGQVSNASPLRNVLIATLYVTFQRDLEREVPHLIEQLIGRPVPDALDSTVTVLAIAVAIMVVDAAVERLLPGKSTKKLQRELNAQIERISELTALPPDRIRAALNERFGRGRAKSLFRRAHDFFLPAKHEPGAGIRIDDQHEIGFDVIDEVPTELQLDDEERRNVYELFNVVVEIHRADVDYQKQGWRAIVADVSERRARLLLPLDVLPADLYGATSVRADVVVVEERQMDGDYTVKEYQLQRIHNITKR